MKKALIAGPLNLDITPDLSNVPEGQFINWLQLRKTAQVSGAILHPGGAVSNIGLALHRLGTPVRLIGKIGDDPFGQAIQEKIGMIDPHLASDLVIDPGGETGTSLIINPSGDGCTVIHSQGVNGTFYASDLPRKALQTVDLFHFGNPFQMRSIFRSEGGELVLILQRARRAGLTTSLDFTLPDPAGPAGRVDWTIVFENALPYADLFLTRFPAVLSLMRRELYTQLDRDPETPFEDAVAPDLLDEWCEIVLGYGVKAVMVICGKQGTYLRSAKEGQWKKGGRALQGLGSSWHDRSLWAPAFKVNNQTTLNAGTAAVAGFLNSLLREHEPETALMMANAAGASSRERDGAIHDLMPMEDLLSRIKDGWETLPLNPAGSDWRKDEDDGVWEKE